MLTETQLTTRKTGIGASEVAAVLGLSPYKTPLQLYLEKRGETSPAEENFAVRFGTAAEAFVLSEFELNHQRQIIRAPDTMRFGVMVAHLDAWVPGEFNVQAKTARSRQRWGERGTDQIPTEYVMQVQAEMLLADVPVTYVPVLFHGSDYAEYEVPADEELQRMIAEAAAEFWDRVQQGNPPEPVTYADAVAMWGKSSREGTVQATEEAQEAVSQLRALKAQREHLENAEEAWKAVVIKSLGDCETLMGPDGKVLATWRLAKSPTRFDAVRFKAAYPELYANYVGAGEPSRRLLLK